MSGHLRFSFAAFLFLAGLLTSPASSNPFDALFGAAPAEAAAPAPAEEQCLAQPGKSTEDGQHWIYRFDGHRKCWFLAAEGTVTVKKSVHHHAAKQHVAAHEENEAAPRKPKAVVDARAELSRSAPAETPRAETAPALELKVADAVPGIATGAAALVPPAPLVAKSTADKSTTDKPTTDQSTTDQLTLDHPTPRQVDVETLLAAAPESDAVAASVPPAPPAAVRMTETGNDGRGWTATWLGLLLITLGLVSLLSSSRTLRGAVSVGRFLAPRTESVPVADEGFRRHL